VRAMDDAPMGYELIPPEGRCVRPEGHDQVEDRTYASLVPQAVVCPGCGRLWSIVVLPMEG
jgi:hypothetical protein